MQYYNKLVKRTLGMAKRDDGKAVCLNQLVRLCCERASVKYRKDVIFKDFGMPLYVKGAIDGIIEKIASEIEKYVDEQELHVCLERLKKREYASMFALDGEGNILSETEFELYLGIPTTVVSDDDADELRKKIDEALHIAD
ncbi:MAG: hypothetical protein K6D98_01110 [Clostridiales bacterium]|nr:hypothetical protein [Clostridiales bacterium]